jgi:hypothetical protein
MKSSKLGLKRERMDMEAHLNPPTPPKRSDVLLSLWNRAVWLDQAINALDKNKKNVTPKLKQLVYMSQVYNQLCKTVLYAMKDEELELRIIELEEKLKNGVLIPVEAKNKR